ncbi:unnamed protein product [Acanthoscelides obtectus]|uniref:DDE Tnp4 domain-containing protein n=3 Tax=Acanthoscelides obtectus TaxID=200917 RepID=A0A9P0PPW8_ACAOB|nr:unnamed protein product [Acanthoscelides obtectus]CAK1627726.1 Protein ALP1-like [Acanthoscelides obtectus]
MVTKKDKRKAAACYYYLTVKPRRRNRRTHRYWVRDWIKRRSNKNIMETLLEEREDPECYKNFLRMSAADFKYLLDKIKFAIEEQNTHMRNAIPAAERLAITLRFLATGDSYHSLMYLFRIPVCTISRIVCAAIYNVLKEEYLQMPCTEEEWLQKSQQFAEKYNFPHCIGALDGKHVLIKAPKQRGSLYYNYKGTHSVVLMALADAEYKFQYINVSCFGRISDGGVFNACSLSNKLADNSLGIPTPRPLPGRTKPVPFVIVADDAFAMKSYIMKPYAFRNLHGEQRIFNYRLSRARRIIENAFGLASARFRILRRPIELGVEKLIHVVSAICVLHNFLMTRSKRLYAPYGSFDVENHETGTIEPGEWRQSTQGLVDLHVNPHLRGNLEAKDVQREFTEYFHQKGEVSWQYKYI